MDPNVFPAREVAAAAAFRATVKYVFVKHFGGKIILLKEFIFSIEILGGS
jgi:hypothetical protein